MRPVLGSEKAVLVCSDPRNMDLVIGQDLTTAYLETKVLNMHSVFWKPCCSGSNATSYCPV